MVMFSGFIHLVLVWFVLDLVFAFADGDLALDLVIAPVPDLDLRW